MNSGPVINFIMEIYIRMNECKRLHKVFRKSGTH